MNVPKKIMVLGGLGDIGRSIRNIIEQNFPDDQVQGADSRADADDEGFVRLEPASHPDYLEHLRDVVKHERVDVLIPTHEAEIEQLALGDAQHTLGCHVLIEAPDSIKIFGDKVQTYEWCVANSISTLPTEILRDGHHLEYPSLLKPRSGSGGKGQVIANSQSDLVRIGSRSEYVVQPLLRGIREFTCVVARRSESIVLLNLERRLDGGRSRWIRVSDDPFVSAAASDIARLLQPNFSINFQFLRTETEALLIDVNPRFSSTVAMRDRIGFSDLCWSLERTLNKVHASYAPPTPGTVVEWLDDDGMDFRVERISGTPDVGP